MSGKTTLALLLNNYIVNNNPNAVVAYIRAHYKKSDATFESYFQDVYGCGLGDFCKKSGDKVVPVDEAQLTYNDTILWTAWIKTTLNNGFPGLRFILFSAYSFSKFARLNQPGTPVGIRSKYKFGLRATQSKPGLELLRSELDEMVGNAFDPEAVNVLWELCSGHIGIAREMIGCLRKKLSYNL